jgi:hypothetical protein
MTASVAVKSKKCKNVSMDIPSEFWTCKSLQLHPVNIKKNQTHMPRLVTIADIPCNHFSLINAKDALTGITLSIWVPSLVGIVFLSPVGPCSHRELCLVNKFLDVEMDTRAKSDE